MKILLISTLYPGYEQESRKTVSHALHYFAKDWVTLNQDVQVIKIWPKYPRVFTSKKNLLQYKQFKNNSEEKIEKVDVKRIFIKKIPRINYFDIHISKAANEIIDFLTQQDNEPDIIVCHMINPSFYIAKILKTKFQVPLILTLHKSDILQLNSRKNFKNFKMQEKYVDSYGFRNRKLLEEFSEFNFNKKENFVIHSGINKELVIRENILEKKIELPIKVIFIASSMIPLKNIDIVILAFEKLNTNYNIRLRIAGDGPQKKKLVELAKETNCYDKIDFLGFISRSEVIKEMEESEIFVMVSSPETFGLVYLEAMAKGCITIGTKGEGIDGVIKNNENGFLITSKNIDELADLFELIIKMNKKDRENIILNAVKTAKSMSQESLSEYYLEKIKEIKASY